MKEQGSDWFAFGSMHSWITDSFSNFCVTLCWITMFAAQWFCHAACYRMFLVLAMNVSHVVLLINAKSIKQFSCLFWGILAICLTKQFFLEDIYNLPESSHSFHFRGTLKKDRNLLWKMMKQLLFPNSASSPVICVLLS